MLNQLQINFCEEILRGESQSKAYEKAGYKCKSKSSSAAGSTNLMKNREVRRYLAERRKEAQEQTDIHQKATLREIARVAFSDIRDFMTWGERGLVFVPSEELTADQAASIQSIRSRRRITTDKDGNSTETIDMEVKLHPKMDALEKLAKVQGLYQADRMNDADAQRDLLKTVMWRYVLAVHMDTGMSVREALKQAEKNPEEVQKWGREVMLIPSESSSSEGRKTEIGSL